MNEYKILADHLLKGRLQNDTAAQYRNPFVKILVLMFPITVYVLSVSIFNKNSGLYISNFDLMMSILVTILLQSADFRANKIQSYVWKLSFFSIILLVSYFTSDVDRIQNFILASSGFKINFGDSESVRSLLIFASLLLLLRSPKIFSLRDVNLYFRLNRKSSKSRLLEIGITTFFVVQNSVSRRFRTALDVAKRRMYMMDPNISLSDRVSRSASIFFLTLWEQLHEMVLLASSLYQDRKFNSDAKTADKWLAVAWGLEDLVGIILISLFYFSAIRMNNVVY